MFAADEADRAHPRTRTLQDAQNPLRSVLNEDRFKSRNGPLTSQGAGLSITLSSDLFLSPNRNKPIATVYDIIRLRL